jgi:hypothetical protein
MFGAGGSPARNEQKTRMFAFAVESETHVYMSGTNERLCDTASILEVN